MNYFFYLFTFISYLLTPITEDNERWWATEPLIILDRDGEFAFHHRNPIVKPSAEEMLLLPLVEEKSGEIVLMGPIFIHAAKESLAAVIAPFEKKGNSVISCLIFAYGHIPMDLYSSNFNVTTYQGKRVCYMSDVRINNGLFQKMGETLIKDLEKGYFVLTAQQYNLQDAIKKGSLLSYRVMHPRSIHSNQLIQGVNIPVRENTTTLIKISPEGIEAIRKWIKRGDKFDNPAKEDYPYSNY